MSDYDKNNIYVVNSQPFSGSRYEDLYHAAKALFKELKGTTKRKMYLRSVFFHKEKVFLDYFWEHLFQKPTGQRKSRLKFLPCAIDLIKNSNIPPSTQANPNKTQELLYRFYGVTKKRQTFVVQIKENMHKEASTKQFISVFPWK